jgi:hypothetical protein
MQGVTDPTADEGLDSCSSKHENTFRRGKVVERQVTPFCSRVISGADDQGVKTGIKYRRNPRSKYRYGNGSHVM